MNITKTNKKSIKEYISLLNILIFISIDKKNKKINTIRKLREQRLFTPSIKLNPFINTKKKNEIINILKISFPSKNLKIEF